MVQISSLKSMMRFFKPKQLVKSAVEVRTAPSSCNELKIIVDKPELRIMEQVRGDKLFSYETRIIDGKLTSTTRVWGDKGAHIGKGGSEGLDISRTKTVQVEKGESAFGGDKITINKNYRDTMAMTQCKETMVKEYTPEGVYEHGEQYLKYLGCERPTVNKYDRIIYANGETPYSEAVKAKKAAEAAQKAEQEAALAAALKAEQEAAAKLAAETPRVNIGKVFNKNLDELQKMQEKTLADGTIVRAYRTKDRKGFSQYIITKDRGSYHEEYIKDMAKNMKIKYTQIGDARPNITMSKGSQYRQTLSLGGNWREDTRIYNNGRDYVEFKGSYREPYRFNIHTSTRHIAGDNQVPDINANISYKPYVPVSEEAVAKLEAIRKEASSEYVDLKDLFSPYAP